MSSPILTPDQNQRILVQESRLTRRQLPKPKTRREVQIEENPIYGPQLHPDRKMNNIRKEIHAQAQARAQAAKQQEIQAQLPQQPHVEVNKESAAPQTPPNPLRERASKEAPPSAERVAFSWSVIGALKSACAWCLKGLKSGWSSVFSLEAWETIYHSPRKDKAPEPVTEHNPAADNEARQKAAQSRYRNNEAWAKQTLNMVSGNRTYLAGDGSSVDKVDCLLAAASTHIDNPGIGSSWQSRLSFRNSNEKLADSEIALQRQLRSSKKDDGVDEEQSDFITTNLSMKIDGYKRSKKQHVDAVAPTSQVRVFKYKDKKKNQNVNISTPNGYMSLSSPSSDRYYLLLSEKGNAQLDKLNTSDSDAVVIDVQKGTFFRASEFTDRTQIRREDLS